MKRSSLEERPARRVRRAPRVEQIQARHHRKHSVRRKNLALSQRRLHRPLRWPACKTHRRHRRIQAHERRQRILQGRRSDPQLQRIYGTAFKTKRELDDYFAMLEEAKKRDHRKLGKELEPSFLMTTSVRVCRCSCRGAPSSPKNWRSSPRKLSLPPVINGFALRISRARACTKRADTFPITQNRCFLRWMTD